MREKIFGYALREYGAAPEYLWARYPDYAVLRRSDSKKWFAVIMDIPFEKVDSRKSGIVDENRIYELIDMSYQAAGGRRRK